jgi:hypothetical protein
MAGFQAYIEALKHYIDADEPAEQIQHVIQAFDDYRILTAVRHGPLGIEQLNRYGALAQSAIETNRCWRLVYRTSCNDDL